MRDAATTTTLTHARPLIGLCSRPLGELPGQGGSYGLAETYPSRIFEAGGVPVLLPYHECGPAAARELAQRMDGVLFTGGADIDAASFDGRAYDSATHHPLGDTEPLRDSFESALLDACWNLDVPCLGICRGLQMMNVSRGGTLVRDVCEQEWCDMAPVESHMQGMPFSVPSHDVILEPESSLHRMLGVLETRVNSMHHLAISSVPLGGHVVARAEDGTPEAIDFPGHTFFMGVQWHPEIMATQPQLFEAFIAAARERMEERRG